MKRPLARLGLLVGLILLAMVSVRYPHLMFSPGPLMQAHQEIAQDCFACHDAFQGAAARRCIACHQVQDIGRVTTKGQPIKGSRMPVPFHQSLMEQDCLACHNEHRGTMGKPAVARFSHDLLQVATRDRCESCHRKPDDALHGAISGGCGQCHQHDHWTPADFAHDKYFVLDREHNVACATCHVGNNFRQYTCYGCHEHNPGRVLAEHREEGIRRIGNCIACHRSAAGEGRGEGD